MAWPAGDTLFLVSSTLVTVSLTAAFAWLAARVLPLPAVFVGLALALTGWSMVYAPLKAKRILRVAQDDGGAMPELGSQSVIAVVDRTAERSAALGLCRADCAAILSDGAIKGLFLPRYVDPAGGQIHGVIYRRANFGQDCQEEVRANGGQTVCIAARPATLNEVTHLLETRHLGHGQPHALGIASGSQLRLTDLRQGEVVVQHTAYAARIPARLPFLGDRVADAGSLLAFARPRSRSVTVRRDTTLLITQLRRAVDRQRAGLD